MRWQIWRVAALLLALLSFALLIANALSPPGSQGFSAEFARRPSMDSLRITALLPHRDIHPALRVGDVVRLHLDTLSQRMALGRERPGDAFVFDRAGATPVTVRIVPAPVQPVVWIFVVIDLAFILMGALLALRRPQLGEVRALAALLLCFGLLLNSSSQSWMPDWLVLLVLFAFFPIQVAGLACAVELATTFPDPQAGGMRRIIRRSNYVLSPLFAALGVWSVVSAYVEERSLPHWATIVGSYPWAYYVVAITAAFWIANVRTTGTERTRVRWVSLVLAVAFSGIVAELALYVIAQIRADWLILLQLTIIALPFGLGYAIVRHRVVDIGFVVNRALVFAIVSAIVIASFISLEWLLGTVLVRLSHVTSQSLEWALALVLGISLRPIHDRVEALVDDLFFRERHRADRALRTFAREVAYVTDPRVAIARAQQELVLRTGAPSAAIYVVAGPVAVRVDPSAAVAPPRIDVDDPALVRLRATRAPLALRDLDSALPGDEAFPMTVRDAIAGVVVLRAKANGEAFAPDEIATIELVVVALGNALDALQNAALKAEIARVLTDGAPVESLRRTADTAAWVRGVTPQPAGSHAGLGE